MRRAHSTSLAERAAALREAVEAGGQQWGSAPVAEATAVADKIGERTAIGESHTVVALAGATGSGKSSLFNLIAGSEVAAIGVRRPTTEKASAAIWGSDDAAELLDWLGISRRHQVEPGTDSAALSGTLDGLVLVDLPDVDSNQTDHRQEADRILDRADVFVWVTDPQKYADARLHDEYLARLGHHRPVLVVVLNQVDRLGGEDAEAVADDLRRLVTDDLGGHQGSDDDFPVLVTSARMGTGVDELVEQIGAVVSARQAREQRLGADLDVAVEALHPAVGDREATMSDDDTELVAALENAAAVPVILDAVRRDYRRQSVSRAGWPVTRWLSRFRPDPLRRFRLGDDRAGHSGIRPSDVRTALGRSSLPNSTPAARSAVELAARRLGNQAGADLPDPWAWAVASAVDPDHRDLTDALDQAVMGTSLRARSPLWWPLFGVLQALFFVAAVAGAVWLTVLAVVSWLQLDASAPTWGGLPIPALLLGGGLLLGFLLGVLARVLGRIGANRRQRLIHDRLRTAVAQVADEQVRGPVAEVLERHAAVRAALAKASS